MNPHVLQFTNTIQITLEPNKFTGDKMPLFDHAHNNFMSKMNCSAKVTQILSTSEKKQKTTPSIRYKLQNFPMYFTKYQLKTYFSINKE